MRFAEPISLSELATGAAAADDGDTQVQKLCFEICTRIEHAMPVTLTDVVTLVLLAANGRALDGGQILEQTGLLCKRRDPGLPDQAGQAARGGLLSQYRHSLLP